MIPPSKMASIATAKACASDLKVLMTLLSLMLIMGSARPGSVAGFELEGSRESYAKFPRWVPCQNGSLSLTFRTTRPDGVLLYTDDGGRLDFFEVKLVSGVVRLRWNFGLGSTVLSAAGLPRAHDDQWHTLSVTRAGADTTLTVDHVPYTATSPGNDFDFGDPETNGFLYVGGLPEEFTRRLTELALPSIAFELGFGGAVRDVTLSQCGGDAKPVAIIDSKGVRTNDLDPCQEVNPCRHGGVCISTDGGPTCDCSATDHEGEHCQHERVPSEATFFGEDYLTYNLSSRGDPIVSSRDEVRLDFKTRQPSGLIFFTGDGDNFIIIALEDGGLYVSISLGDGEFDTRIRREGSRFDDNHWHSLTVTRRAREVEVFVDGNDLERSGTTVGEFTMLSSKLLYVGGSPNPSELGDGPKVTDSFRGCLRKVQYKADSIHLDLLDLAKTNHNLIQTHGRVLFDRCRDLATARPVTFLAEQSYITLPPWDTADGSIELQFRTTEPDGLLMYSLGQEGTLDFFGLEMLQGFLYLVINMGSGTLKVVASKDRVDDGILHKVVLRMEAGRRGTVRVDDHSQRFRLKGKSDNLDLQGSPLYIGGISHDQDSRQMPLQLWSAMLRHGFVGCMQEVRVNKEDVSLVDLALAQDVQGIGHYCRAMKDQCLEAPCLHSGECSEGWNRYVCDCATSSYTGQTCNRPAATLNFSGSEYMQIVLPEESRTEVEDISLRFRTDQSDALLLATLSDTTSDRIELMLEDSQVRLDIDLGSGTKSLYMGQGLADDFWHTVKVKRRAQRVELRVDNSTEITETLAESNPIMHIDSIRLASLTDGATSGPRTGELEGDSKLVDFDAIQIAEQPTGSAGEDLRSRGNFRGKMQQLLFNGNDFIEMARTGLIQNVRTNARLEEHDKLVNFPITFRSAAAYMTTTLKIYAKFTIYFQVKTTQPDGLILYSGGGGSKDFMSLEIVNGQIRFIYDVGSGPRVVRSNMKQPINDNKWHDVAILRPTLNQHILRVDETARFDELPDRRSVHFDTDGVFYVGGIDRHMFNALPQQVKSREGFQGCLGSLDLDGDSRNILEQHRSDIADEYKDAISAGCEGPTTECTQNSCHNGGQCIQEWNSYRCDCDMTSFTGPTCNEDGIAYTFGSGGGLITFNQPQAQWQDTKADQLALGFSTTQRDAVLGRINSGNSEDYIEMELVDGNVFVVYDMGTMHHPIGQLFQKANDGRYHVIRFTRNGPNSTIQMDDLQIQTKHPSGSQRDTFNAQSQVYIGGRKDDSGAIVRPFHGTIAGLNLNGLPILEKAAVGDPRITIEGDVQLEMQPIDRIGGAASATTPSSPVIVTPAAPVDGANSSMQSTMGVETTPRVEGVSDDFIFSGINTGCQEDDDDCSKVDGGDADDLVKAKVTVKSTVTTTTPSSVAVPELLPVPGESSGEGPCEADDEDCDNASGIGGVVEPSGPSKSPDNDGDIDIDDNLGGLGSHGRSTTPAPLLVMVNMTTAATHKGPWDPVPGDGGGDGGDPSPSSGGNGGVGGGSGGTNAGAGANLRDGSGGGGGGGTLGMNIGLIVGIAVGVVLLLLILAFALYKYKSRDEGSYKIDESKNYSYETCNTKPPPHVNGGMAKSGTNCSKSKKKDVKEWYV